MLRIAFLQIAPAGSLDGNLRRGIEMCRKAKDLSADIALFPEMWSNGYDISERPSDEWTEDAISSDSTFIKSFSSLSAELGMAIAVTFLERGNKVIRCIWWVERERRRCGRLQGQGEQPQ